MRVYEAIMTSLSNNNKKWNWLLSLAIMLGMLGIITAFSVVACTAEEVLVVYGKEHKINISSNHVNRLSFGKRYIKAIVADEHKYNAILQNNNSEIFLSSKIEAPATLHLSLILASGEVIDIAANVIDKEEPSIINFVFLGESKENLTAEIEQMLRSMKEGKADKYYVKHLQQAFSDDLALNFIEKERYQYENLHGVIIEVSADEKQLEALQMIEQEKIKQLLKSKYIEVGDELQKIEFSSVVSQKATIYVIYKKGDR